MAIALQVCAECGTVNYPARQVCRKCLSERLEVKDLAGSGVLLAHTSLFASADTFFQNNLPWRIGSVRLETGPIVIAHLTPQVNVIGQKIDLFEANWRGRRVFVAMAQGSQYRLADFALS